MHTLPDLGYGYDDLKRSISRDVMETHHAKHHQAYVDKLNAALKDHPDFASLPIEELMRAHATLPDELKGAVRNMGGGHFNHSLFWTHLAPDGGGEPGGALGAALVERYGSYQGFVDAFSEKALGVFGSGWAWLMPDLSIETSPNQDTPVTSGKPTPLLALDVWEHAYYLDYRHKRADYVKAWWDVVNWKQAEDRYGR